MNRLKSLFITLYITSLFVGFIWSLEKLVVHPSEVRNLAGALICLLPILYFGYLYWFKPSKVGGLTTVITSLVGTTFLIVLGRTIFLTNAVNAVFVFSLVSLVGWGLYLLWYSKFSSRGGKILEGKTLTGLTFANVEGEKFQLVPDQHTYHILLFHRGNWCPLCMAQVNAIADQYKAMMRRNVQVHIISPVNEKWSKKLADKHDVPYNFLIDKNLTVSKQLGIMQSHGIPFGFQLLGFDSETILPTVILLDKNLKVLRIHETDDYKKRPDPDFFLRLIDSYE